MLVIAPKAITLKRKGAFLIICFRSFLKVLRYYIYDSTILNLKNDKKNNAIENNA